MSLACGSGRKFMRSFCKFNSLFFPSGELVGVAGGGSTLG